MSSSNCSYQPNLLAKYHLTFICVRAFHTSSGDNPSAVRVLTSRLAPPSLNLRIQDRRPWLSSTQPLSRSGGANLWPKCHVPSTLSLESESSTLSFCCHLCLQWICFKIIIPSQIMCPELYQPHRTFAWGSGCFPKSLLSKLALECDSLLFPSSRRAAEVQRDWTSSPKFS